MPCIHCIVLPLALVAPMLIPFARYVRSTLTTTEGK